MVNSLAQEAGIHCACDGDAQWLVNFMKRLNQAKRLRSLSGSAFWLDAMCDVKTLCNRSCLGCDNHIWQEGRCIVGGLILRTVT